MPDARREDPQGEPRVVGELLRRSHRHVTVEEADALAEVDRGGRLRSPSHRPHPLEQARARSGHVPGVQVVVLHEALGRQSAIGAVPHRDRERFLFLEPEPVRLAPGASMKSIAHAPKKFLGSGELLRLPPDEDPEPHELAPRTQLRVAVAVRDPVARASTPARAVEVAKPPRAALHVRLEQVHRAAETLVARRGFGFEAVDEGAKRLLAEEPLVRAGDDVAQRSLVSREHAQIEQRRRGGEIGLGQRNGVGHAEDLVADGERRVP